MEFLLFTDGGSRNNPGPAGIGFVVYNTKESQKPYYCFGKRIGVATNNVAEYTALIEGLKYCQNQNAKNIQCFLDSALVVNQLNGKFKIKEPTLMPLVKIIKEIEKQIGSVTYTYIPREKNKLADKLVNEALDYVI